jgi:hypothetical protein
MHVIVNKYGTFKNKKDLKLFINDFKNKLPKELFWKNNQCFIDDSVYRSTQLLRITYSPNLSKDSVLKPFIIKDDKLIYKDDSFISNNYEKNLCGNYKKDINDYLILNNILINNNNKDKLCSNYDDKKNIQNNNFIKEYHIPNWKINWIKNNNFVKNIYKINGIDKNKVNLQRIKCNTYCNICKRNHERDNAFCIIYNNNIMFYCNRNNNGISIGSWYNKNNYTEDDKEDDKKLIKDLMEENKYLKKEIEKLKKMLIKHKDNKKNDIWNYYYNLGNLLIDNKIDSFRNIIIQDGKVKDISKIKNRCIRVYKYMNLLINKNIHEINIPLREIFHIPNWKFDEFLSSIK